jgi:hypothetical protein
LTVPHAWKISVCLKTTKPPKEMAEVKHYPTADAIGDWLRRHGGSDGERRVWTVTSSLIQTMTGGSRKTLDVDGTIIEADKGDARDDL